MLLACRGVPPDRYCLPIRIDHPNMDTAVGGFMATAAVQIGGSARSGEVLRRSLSVRSQRRPPNPWQGVRRADEPSYACSSPVAAFGSAPAAGGGRGDDQRD